MSEASSGQLCLVVLSGLPASGKTTLVNTIWEHFQRGMTGSLQVGSMLVCPYDELMPPEVEQKLLRSKSENETSQWKLYREHIQWCIESLIRSVIGQNTGQATPVYFQQEQQGLTRLVRSDVQPLETDQSKVSENEPIPCGASSHPVSSAADSDNFHARNTGVIPGRNDKNMPDPGLRQPDVVSADLWERFCKCIDRQSQKFAKPFVVIVDDNMYYTSMRYSYYQLARKYCIGFCQIYVDCSLQQAKARNNERSSCVAEDVIISMADKLEKPDPKSNPWEKFSLNVNTDWERNNSLCGIYQMIQSAMLDPVQPEIKEDPEQKAESRRVCSNNIIHQADQILRKFVSKEITAAKSMGISKEEIQDRAKTLGILRTKILADMKSGTILLPESIEYIEDSFRKPNSSLFKFVEKIFYETDNR